MDVFMSDLYCDVFHTWILGRLSEGYVVENSENEVRFSTDAAKSRVTFHDMDIIEMEITNTKKEDTEFYLHFQMNNLKHATDLFTQMLETVDNMAQRKTLRVLLSCSGGLTTSFFASELQNAAEALSLDYEFEAVAFTELPNVGDEYDIILLAPQIAYMKASLASSVSNTTIIDIPAPVFAKYDGAGCIKLIQDTLAQNEVTDEESDATLENLHDIKNELKILSLIIIRHRKNTKIAYRLYDKDDILMQNEIRKCTLHLNRDDIYDILDTVTALHTGIDAISIAMPGAIYNNAARTATFTEFTGPDFAPCLEEKYGIPVYLYNDVNTAVTGLYANKGTYENVGLYYCGAGNSCGGCGLIINGRLVTGYRGQAGELRFTLLGRTADSFDVSTVEKTIDMATEFILDIIAVAAPDYLGIYEDGIPDLEALRENLLRYVPETALPELCKVYYIHKHMFLGSLILTNKAFREKNA